MCHLVPFNITFTEFVDDYSTKIYFESNIFYFVQYYLSAAFLSVLFQIVISYFNKEKNMNLNYSIVLLY